MKERRYPFCHDTERCFIMKENTRMLVHLLIENSFIFENNIYIREHYLYSNRMFLLKLKDIFSHRVCTLIEKVKATIISFAAKRIAA